MVLKKAYILFVDRKYTKETRDQKVSNWRLFCLLFILFF